MNAFRILTAIVCFGQVFNLAVGMYSLGIYSEVHMLLMLLFGIVGVQQVDIIMSIHKQNTVKAMQRYIAKLPSTPISISQK